MITCAMGGLCECHSDFSNWSRYSTPFLSSQLKLCIFGFQTTFWNLWKWHSSFCIMVCWFFINSRKMFARSCGVKIWTTSILFTCFNVACSFMHKQCCLLYFETEFLSEVSEIITTTVEGTLNYMCSWGHCSLGYHSTNHPQKCHAFLRCLYNWRINNRFQRTFTLLILY